MSKRTCEWYLWFKSGDFYEEDRHSGGRPPVCEVEELEFARWSQIHKELARWLEVSRQAVLKRLMNLGMIQKTRIFGQILVEIERCLWTISRKTKTERVYASHCDWFIAMTPSAENHGLRLCDDG